MGSSGGGVATTASGRRRRFPVVNVLTVYLVLLVGVPATLVVGPLGAAGSPAILFGLGCLVLWIVARIDRRFGLVRGRQPMRVVTVLYACAMVCGYAAGAMRVATPVEIRSADRAFLKLLAGAGILLLTADGLRDRADLGRLLRGISVAGGVLAFLGVVQFVFGIEVTTYIKIPGLVSNDPAQLIQQRSIFRRVSGTTSHPIEFGVTLAMLFPIALHCAFNAVRRRWVHWSIAIIIAAAIPMSISRSAILGLTLSWTVMLIGWEPRRRINALLATPFALALMRLVIPGLLGTIKSLFTGISNDPSYLGRTQDYEFVNRYIAESPWIGRGLGTFVPEVYTTLDNQYLGQIVETGYIGLTALVLLLGSGLVLGWLVRRRATEPVQRSMGVALAAAAIVPLSTFITFDGLSFPVITGFTYLVLGCAGAATRLYRPAGRDRSPGPSSFGRRLAPAAG